MWDEEMALEVGEMFAVVDAYLIQGKITILVASAYRQIGNCCKVYAAAIPS